jgi:hypothetical protein
MPHILMMEDAMTFFDSHWDWLWVYFTVAHVRQGISIGISVASMKGSVFISLVVVE